MRQALIDSATNECVNIIEWDGVSNWRPPAGHFITPLGDEPKGMGWRWDGSALTIAPAALPLPPVDPIGEFRKALEADPLLLDKIKALK